MKYDVIIIGAGLAGATCGYLFRKQDKKVLIIEKESIKKKDKLCGGLLTDKSYKLFNELYPDNKLKFEEFDHFYIINNNKRVKLKDSFHSIYRKNLDDYALKEYLKLDGEILDEVEDYKLDKENNKITIGRKSYKYDILIGADGVFSPLRKKVTGRMQDRVFAYEFNGPIKDDLYIFFFKNFKGYGWIIPNKKNSVIGIGDYSKGNDIHKVFDKFLKDIDVPKKDVRGAFLPTGRDIYLRNKNIFFIGDASGVISPILGEGIYYAMLTAKLVSENPNKNYTSSLKQVFKRFDKEKIYSKYAYNESTRNLIFDHSHNKLIHKGIYHFIRKHL